MSPTCSGMTETFPYGSESLEKSLLNVTSREQQERCTQQRRQCEDDVQNSPCAQCAQ